MAPKYCHRNFSLRVTLLKSSGDAKGRKLRTIFLSSRIPRAPKHIHLKGLMQEVQLNNARNKETDPFHFNSHTIEHINSHGSCKRNRDQGFQTLIFA